MSEADQGLGEMVRRAASIGITVPAFNVPYLPMIAAICETLETHDTFGMIEVARPDIEKFEARGIPEVAQEYRRVSNPLFTSLHLDHVPVIDEDGLEVDWEALISEGIDCGYDSVMIDASRLPLEANMAITAHVVELAHPEGVLVEAELGSVLGHEAGPLPPYEELFSGRMGFTDPDEARDFVLSTEVDWLSISIGSVHGAISGAARDQEKVQAKLDIDHLKMLKEATGIPLVLHGGSGIRQFYVDEAIRNGIAKINIGTQIRQPYERKLADTGSTTAAQEAVADTVSRLIRDVYHIEGSASRLRGSMGQRP